MEERLRAESRRFSPKRVEEVFKGLTIDFGSSLTVFVVVTVLGECEGQVGPSSVI